jgi:hypothetical protein
VTNRILKYCRWGKIKVNLLRISLHKFNYKKFISFRKNKEEEEAGKKKVKETLILNKLKKVCKYKKIHKILSSEFKNFKKRMKRFKIS